MTWGGERREEKRWARGTVRKSEKGAWARTGARAVVPSAGGSGQAGGPRKTRCLLRPGELKLSPSGPDTVLKGVPAGAREPARCVSEGPQAPATSLGLGKQTQLFPPKRLRWGGGGPGGLSLFFGTRFRQTEASHTL